MSRFLTVENQPKRDPISAWKCLQSSWERIQQDENNGIFYPETERDIKSLLYHYLIVAGLRPDEIYTEVKLKLKGGNRFPDLVIQDRNKEEEENADDWYPLLVAEVKIAYSNEKKRTQDNQKFRKWAKELPEEWFVKDRQVLTELKDIYKKAEMVQMVYFTKGYRESYWKTYSEIKKELGTWEKRFGIRMLVS